MTPASALAPRAKMPRLVVESRGSLSGAAENGVRHRSPADSPSESPSPVRPYTVVSLGRPSFDTAANLNWGDKSVLDPGPHVSEARRVERLVLRAWSSLSRFRLEDASQALDALDRAAIGEIAPRALKTELQLLRVAQTVLRGDVNSVAEFFLGALPLSPARCVHPAAVLLERCAFWNAGQVGAFYAVRRPHSMPASRRERRLSVLHLTLEAFAELDKIRLTTAERLAIEARDEAKGLFGSEFAGLHLATTIQAAVLYEQGRLDAADPLIRGKFFLRASQGGMEGAIRSYTLVARIAVAKGQMSFAFLLLGEAEALGMQRGWTRLVAQCLGERVRILTLDGQVEEAKVCVDRLVQLDCGPTASADDLSRYLVVAQAHLALAGMPNWSTVAGLRGLLAAPSTRRDEYARAEVQILVACVLHRLGELGSAKDAALEVLSVGAARGLYRRFLDIGAPAQALLTWVFDRGPCADDELAALGPYIHNLLRGFCREQGCVASSRSKHRSGESLSPRERDIVDLMSRGLSNKRIGKQLAIAPETVKSHAKHILMKLAAQTRVEAVSRAISLGIV